STAFRGKSLRDVPKDVFPEKAVGGRGTTSTGKIPCSVKQIPRRFPDVYPAFQLAQKLGEYRSSAAATASDKNNLNFIVGRCSRWFRGTRGSHLHQSVQLSRGHVLPVQCLVNLAPHGEASLLSIRWYSNEIEMMMWPWFRGDKASVVTRCASS